MRKRFLRFLERQLARAERVVKAWPHPEDMDVYMYKGERDHFGYPKPTKLEPGDAYNPPLPAVDQLRNFWRKVILKEDPKLEFQFKVDPQDAIRIVEWN